MLISIFVPVFLFVVISIVLTFVFLSLPIKRPAGEVSTDDKPARIQRILLAITVSLFCIMFLQTAICFFMYW